MVNQIVSFADSEGGVGPRILEPNSEVLLVNLGNILHQSPVSRREHMMYPSKAGESQRDCAERKRVGELEGTQPLSNFDFLKVNPLITNLSNAGTSTVVKPS
ncbi:hypothetical protein C7212DRAFT_363024 [Tuber magnatum]|uniref:Uncharacterized protein n=1 Tax=Tuber magnatum TaxID=42249 RepID=A0A317SUM4_9PEZI|nr:hypothetical protein C7212DRAFT_363024 [Tuber magnatum]